MLGRWWQNRKSGLRKGNFFRKARQWRGWHHVLDDLEPSERLNRLARARRIRWGLRFALVAVGLVAAGFLTSALVKRKLAKNDEFVVRDIVVDGLISLTPADVIRMGGLEEGDSIFSLNLSQAAAKIRNLAQVKEVTIERRPPIALHVSITERTPIAWLKCGHPLSEPFTTRTPFRGGYLLDAEGVPFPCEIVRPALARLPIVDVPTLPHLKPGAPLDDIHVQRSLRLLSLLREPVLRHSSIELMELVAHKEWGLQVGFDHLANNTRHRTKSLFAIEELEEQVGRLEAIWNLAEQQRKVPATINVIPKKSVPVTWVGATADPTPEEPATIPASSRQRTPRR